MEPNEHSIDTQFTRTNGHGMGAQLELRLLWTPSDTFILAFCTTNRTLEDDLITLVFLQEAFTNQSPMKRRVFVNFPVEDFRWEAKVSMFGCSLI